MRIGIDISQLAYEKTGVENYLSNLIKSLLKADKANNYVLFFSSLRRDVSFSDFNIGNVRIKKIKLPPTLLSFLWNRLHVLPIEWFIGDIDWLITSDWTEPPTRKAKKATILYDLIVYKNPEETDNKIVRTQKLKLAWVKKESTIVFCISESTKKDAQELLGIEENKLRVIYPGLEAQI